MGMTFEQFARECSELLTQETGPVGRQKVCDLMQQVLRDPAFVEAVVPERTTDRELRYQDPKLGFCIFAEHKSGARTGEPHDHGPSWAIYGQAAGVTQMSEWTVVSPAEGDRPGKVRRSRHYEMAPGAAYVYNEGVLHSPSRTGPTRLVRIEGMNLAALRSQRPKYEVVD